MPNLANTFVDDITPAIYKYNREPSKESYECLVFSCRLCLSRYSGVIKNIEEECIKYDDAINNRQDIDNILKRLDQIKAVLNQFDEYQIGSAGKSFIPVALKLGKEIKSMEYYSDEDPRKLQLWKKELESFKDIIANKEADILIPKIQELNNRVRLLQDNIRSFWMQAPSEKVNTTPVLNLTLSNQVGIVNDDSKTPMVPSKCKEVGEILEKTEDKQRATANTVVEKDLASDRGTVLLPQGKPASKKQLVKLIGIGSVIAMLAVAAGCIFGNVQFGLAIGILLASIAYLVLKPGNKLNEVNPSNDNTRVRSMCDQVK